MVGLLCCDKYMCTFLNIDSGLSSAVRTTKSKRAGLIFPVGRLKRQLQKGKMNLVLILVRTNFPKILNIQFSRTKQFPFFTSSAFCCTGRYANRISDMAAVTLGGCLEYLVSELVDLAGGECHRHNRSRVIPRHILLCVTKDAELSEFLKNVTISEGGHDIRNPVV